MKTREQLEVEAKEWLSVHVRVGGLRQPLGAFPAIKVQSKSLADWAESIQREAVDEERKALREIVQTFQARGYAGIEEEIWASLLAALDARSKL